MKANHLETFEVFSFDYDHNELADDEFVNVTWDGGGTHQHNNGSVAVHDAGPFPKTLSNVKVTGTTSGSSIELEDVELEA